MSAPVRIRLSRRKGWRLPPNTASDDALYAILDDRWRPFYEHRIAA